jgi:DNA-binding transcriptional regulator LsrR (DeoR family)
MTQAERDRLVALKKAKKKLITQREAAEEMGLSIRQVKRLLKALKKRGDKAVIISPKFASTTHTNPEDLLSWSFVQLQ